MAMAMVILHTYAYPALLIFIIVARITDKAWKRYQQQQRLAMSACWSRLVPYVCLGCVHAMGAKRLVPGDVIVIQPGVAMCDAVLLRGGALCEQSTLTGEVRHDTDYWTAHSPVYASEYLTVHAHELHTSVHAKSCLTVPASDLRACT